jgi:hypothetical protein
MEAAAKAQALLIKDDTKGAPMSPSISGKGLLPSSDGNGEANKKISKHL